MSTTNNTTNGGRRGRMWLLWLPGLAVAIGAGAATAHGLFEVAADAGVPAGLAWLYPLITDGLALVAYVSTIRLRDGDRAYAWSVVVLAAGLSGLAQAAYLAGGVGDVSTALRFGVGAWPAVAAAIVAHLLFLLGHATTTGERETADREQLADPAPASGADESPGVQREPFRPAVQSDVQRRVQPAAEPQRVQESGVQASRVEPRPVASGRAAGRREQARVVARRFAREHDRLPTVSELQDAAEVSRGSAHAALKELREHPTHLHVVNADQEAAQP